jgi:hypothetical protein
MIQYDDLLPDEHISFQMDSVLSRYHRSIAYGAIVVDHNYGLACGVFGGDDETRILS